MHECEANSLLHDYSTKVMVGTRSSRIIRPICIRMLSSGWAPSSARFVFCLSRSCFSLVSSGVGTVVLGWCLLREHCERSDETRADQRAGRQVVCRISHPEQSRAASSSTPSVDLRASHRPPPRPAVVGSLGRRRRSAEGRDGDRGHARERRAVASWWTLRQRKRERWRETERAGEW
jgi:hypothetical protein